MAMGRHGHVRPCGRRERVGLVVVIAAALWVPLNTTLPESLSWRSAPTHSLSCKPSLPVSIEADQASNGERWTLTLRSHDADRRVRVWMASGHAGPTFVWHGNLTRDVASTVRVDYHPAESATEVFVGVEAADCADIVRAVASVPIPGRVRPTVPAGQLLRHPVHGAAVRQFVGVRGGTR